MQIYYFSRTGRSKAIAEQLAARYGVSVRIIDDHRDWSGKVNYMKAGAIAISKRAIPADYIEPDIDDDIIVVFPLWAGTMPPAVRTFAEAVGRANITAIVTSLGSILNDKEGFKNVIDLVGQEITAPDDEQIC